MADFRKIAAWQKADDLALRVYQATRVFPDEERFGLTSQLRRAVISVPANIAEGAGRQTLKDFRQFLFVARGSLNEVEYYVHLAQRLGYWDNQEANHLEQERQEVGRLLNGLIGWVSQELDAGRTEL